VTNRRVIGSWVGMGAYRKHDASQPGLDGTSARPAVRYAWTSPTGRPCVRVGARCAISGRSSRRSS